MQLLKIDNNEGLFLDESGAYSSVEKITKDHLLRLVNLTLTKKVTFDEYDKEKLANRAHQIVYKNICEKLSALDARKEEFVDSSERLFLKEYEKYQQDAETRKE